jgi:hypothetical protein
VEPLLAAPPSMLLPEDWSPFMLLHADSAIASKPAKTTLWCLCFMINSSCLDVQWVRDDAACHFGKRPERNRRSS